MKDNYKKTETIKPFCQLLESAEELTGRKLSDIWEIETVKLINEFKNTTAAGAAAVQEHWFGQIFDNYIVAPHGLANYLFEIYSKWLWLRDIIPIRPEAIRPQRPIPEFNYAELHRFREWVNGKYFHAKASNGNIIDIIADRRDDLIILRKKGKESWELTKEHLAKNPNLLKPFENKI